MELRIIAAIALTALGAHAGALDHWFVGWLMLSWGACLAWDLEFGEPGE